MAEIDFYFQNNTWIMEYNELKEQMHKRWRYKRSETQKRNEETKPTIIWFLFRKIHLKNDLNTETWSVMNIRNKSTNDEGKKEVKLRKEMKRHKQRCNKHRKHQSKNITNKELKVLCVFPRTVQVHFSLLPASSIGTTASTCSGSMGRFHIF